MSMTFDQWKADVTGKKIGDGQCVALSADYVNRCLGSSFVSTNYGPHSGYAIGSWDSGITPPGMTRIAGDAIQAGDVLFMRYGTFPFYQLSHTCVATGPVTLGMIPCISQNSPQQWAAVQNLPDVGVAGFWRPGNGQGGAGEGAGGTDALGLPSIPQGTDLLAPLAGVMGVADTINKLSGKLSNPVLWRRVGLFALGAALLWVAAVKIIGSSETVTDLTKGLTS